MHQGPNQNIEDAFVAASRNAGYQPNAAVMRQVAIEVSGGVMTEHGLIVLPGKGALSPVDLARSLRNQMPGAFSRLSDIDEPSEPSSNLTTDMSREIAASRNRTLPSNWHDVRKQYSAKSLTGKMMDELAAARRS
jgi:hypothetical protein